MATWTSSPDAVVTFSRYCAPTALAGLMDCTTIEAAETLLAVPGMAHPTKGSVKTARWQRWLRDELGLVEVATERSSEEMRQVIQQRMEEGGWTPEPGWSRLWFRTRPVYGYEERYAPNRHDSSVRFPTVAQWLKENPRATGIICVSGHTLYVEDGQVAADTLRTKSMRARIIRAHLVPGTAGN